ncbi:MAG: hypothetical protein BM560_06920 [Roseobacter sp. MedPE-SWde]|nr:MAG: hypothetical protein BM560_06920 [Roseobacter sp. MedPE-SWde]
MKQILSRVFGGLASLAIASSVTAIAKADEDFRVTVPDEYRGCVETPYQIGDNLFDNDGSIVAFPYSAGIGESLKVDLVSATTTNSVETARMRVSCSGFRDTSSLDLVFEFGEGFPFRIGYYAWTELLLLYSEAEAGNRRLGRSFYYLAMASGTVMSGTTACSMPQSYDPSWDMFCTGSDVLRQVAKIQKFHDQLVALDYNHNEVSPEAVVDFGEMIATSLSNAREISAGLSR